ncbi:piwi-like protein 1 [Paramacrobiotus metropolitanus]|uniref:piwi-like protein 1 n=1 Tax=Paramacrobiotus metropolitanus TaxID=2943436 RepID=UPI00244657B1|nr:piwi-like protein 1 [Paramacrobiotus metropolitanus]
MASRQVGSGRGIRPNPTERPPDRQEPSGSQSQTSQTRARDNQATTQRVSTLPLAPSRGDRVSVVEQYSRRNRPHGSPGGSSDSGSQKAPSPSERTRLSSMERARHRAAHLRGNQSPEGEEAYTREPVRPLHRQEGFAARTELVPRGRFGGAGISEENLRTRPDKFKNQKAGSRDEGVSVKLLANYVSLDSKWDTFVVLFDVQFEPAVLDGRRRREYVKKLMQENRVDEVSYAYNRQAGLLLQGLAANRIGESVEKSFAINGGHEKCRIARARVINQNDPEILFVLNNFKNRWLDENLNLSMINRCHYDPQKKILVSDGTVRVTLWPGFATAIGFHDHGILLNIDNRFKVIREVTMFELIDDGFRRFRGSRQEVEQMVSEEIVGSIVITQYADKPRTYRVTGVDWGLEPATATFEKNGQKISLANYFREQYNVTLRQTHQPILLAEESGAARFRVQGKERKVMLVPELCKPTGLTNAMRDNFRFMKEMSNHTLQAPVDRMRTLFDFMDRLLRNPDVNKFVQSWGIDFGEDLLGVRGRQLRPAALLQGAKKVTYDAKIADWQKDIRASKFHTPPKVMPANEVILVYPRRFEHGARGLFQSLCEVGSPMGLRFGQPATYTYEYDRDILEILRKYVRKTAELVIVILPSKTKTRYDDVKLFLCRELPAVSQCVVQKTLEKQAMLKSVATKIAIQIGAKLAGAPWALDMNRFAMKHNIMCVGVDTFHDSGSRGASRSAVAVVGTLNNASTRFSSTVFFQSSRQEISDDLANAVKKLLDHYNLAEKGFPGHVMFYRDGVGAGQLETVYRNEVQAVVKAIREKSPQAKVTFVVVTKRHNTRFVVDTDDQRMPFVNPLPGTVVDSAITKPNRMDFYLVAQTVRQGTVAPTYYHCLFDDSMLSIDQLQQFTYAQCCMYFNWSGTVKVPAPCQYAHKLAFLVGQSIHDVPHQDLEQFLYYL